MKRIILTERDNQIIEFLTQYKCATTSTISDLFFNGSRRPTTRRLKHLKEHGFIKSSQEYVSIEQVHYINKKPTQLKHSCICSEFACKMKLENNIIKEKVEFKLCNIRADLLLITDQPKIYFVEICNTKPFDVNKYIRLKKSMEWKKVFPVFPDIIVISNKKVNTTNELNIIKYNLKLEKE
ncbi:hypothetical protein SDC9_55744 [bioreactor metagenome]|uniref:Uncharacterized protein n=1 Tax=bioreactor metagenome TaxID=1076179 RepID=A0A644X0F4_9ZZZZ